MSKVLLPHHLNLLDNLPSKESIKNLVKSNVTDYWETLLRIEATQLVSLQFFNPDLYSLKHPSQIWMTSSISSFECTKSTILSKMKSGRYRSEYLCRHWSISNKNGFCLADTCYEVLGDLVHVLVICPALQLVRARLV